MTLKSREHLILSRNSVDNSVRIRFLLKSEPTDIYVDIFNRKSDIFKYNKKTKSIECSLTQKEYREDISSIIDRLEDLLIKSSLELEKDVKKNITLKKTMKPNLVIVTDGLSESSLEDYINRKISNESVIN